MLTPAQFFTRHPEFAGEVSPYAYTQSKLDEAAEQMDPALWGSKFDTGQGYLAAHLLAMSPMGNTAKLIAGTTTTYEQHYKRLLRIVTSGIRNT